MRGIPDDHLLQRVLYEFNKAEQLQPKDESLGEPQQELTPAEYKLAAINIVQTRINRLVHKRMRKEEKESVVILEDLRTTFIREALHDLGVVPVFNAETDLWELFTGKHPPLFHTPRLIRFWRRLFKK